MRTVAEVLGEGPVPLWRHPEWRERFSWLEQGTTGRGDGAEPFDLGAFGASPIGRTLERWRALRLATGMETTVHARQIHGAEIGTWDTGLPSGAFFGEGLDAHVSSVPELLLTVSVADCVPIFVLGEDPRLVGLVHAGWRGVAGGVAEGIVEKLRQRGAVPERLWAHCGPAICGHCYEVGPEVHAAVDPGLPPPYVHAPIDLRRAIFERLQARGVTAERISISAHCTRCGPGSFFSHRGGSAGRQMGILGFHA